MCGRYRLSRRKQVVEEIGSGLEALGPSSSSGRFNLEPGHQFRELLVRK
jgi:putative SOS response-associated peptidase YedK